VHNGIIENFHELRNESRAMGHEFVTETDSEVIAHLVTAPCTATKVRSKLRDALPERRFRFRHDFRGRGRSDDLREPRRAAGDRFRRSDGSGEMFLVSNALGLAPFTERDRLSRNRRFRRANASFGVVLR
jgi:hypothetical protein